MYFVQRKEYKSLLKLKQKQFWGKIRKYGRPKTEHGNISTEAGAVTFLNFSVRIKMTNTHWIIQQVIDMRPRLSLIHI